MYAVGTDVASQQLAPADASLCSARLSSVPLDVPYLQGLEQNRNYRCRKDEQVE